MVFLCVSGNDCLGPSGLVLGQIGLRCTVFIIEPFGWNWRWNINVWKEVIDILCIFVCLQLRDLDFGYFEFEIWNSWVWDSIFFTSETIFIICLKNSWRLQCYWSGRLNDLVINRFYKRCITRTYMVPYMFEFWISSWYFLDHTYVSGQ